MFGLHEKSIISSNRMIDEPHVCWIIRINNLPQANLTSCRHFAFKLDSYSSYNTRSRFKQPVRVTWSAVNLTLRGPNNQYSRFGHIYGPTFALPDKLSSASVLSVPRYHRKQAHLKRTLIYPAGKQFISFILSFVRRESSSETF